MTTTIRAAVLSAPGEPPHVADVVLPDIGPGQVRVRLAGAGVCHSDLSLANGTLSQQTPAVLGHEGSGTVVEVGAGVNTVAPGDRVLLNWAPACRHCWFCQHGEPYLCEHATDRWTTPYATLTDGTPLYAGLGTAAFAEQTIVPAHALIPLPDDIPLHLAAVLGCAVLTGVGAVLNSARVRQGESVCVIGLGGVGLSVVQGARLAGADPIVAVDVSADKEPLARALGATHVVVSSPDPAAAVRALTGGRGADHVFEVVGTAATIRQAWSLARRGGRATVVGVGSRQDTVSFSALELFHFARTLAGCVYGSSDPDRDVPRLLAHVRAGSLDLAGMVTDQIDLAGVPDAFAAMLAGRGGRFLIRFD